MGNDIPTDSGHSSDWSHSRLYLCQAALPTHVQALLFILPGRAGGETHSLEDFLGATAPGLVVVRVLGSQGWYVSFRLLNTY